MNRSLLAFLVIGLTAAAVGCTSAAGEEGGEAVETARAAITVAPPVGRFVVLARHGASFDDRSNVAGGHVGVSAGATPNTVTAGFDSHTAVGQELISQRVVLRDRATTGNLDADTIVAGTGVVTGTRSPFLAPPAAPTAPAVTAGTTNLTVNTGQTATAAAGSFATVTVNGTLNLSGGVYQLGRLTIGPDGRVLAQAPAIVRIATGVTAGDRARLQPATGTHAGDLVLEAAGTVDAQGSSAALGNDVQLTALVVASGAVRAADRLTGRGALAGQDVILGHDTRMTFDTGFACSTNADCNDNNSCTTDVCADTVCQHTAAANGTACNDSNACTQADACQAGACVGGNPVVCLASDACHDPGTCNPATGICSNPAVPGTCTLGSDVTCGQLYTCAVQVGGQASCWGHDFFGQLGNGGIGDRLTPTPVVGLTNGVVIDGEEAISCASRSDGTVACWGGGVPLGDGVTTSSRVPVTVSGLTDATTVSVGDVQACALRAGGALVCWGLNASGEIGDGTTTDAVLPTAVVGLTGPAVSVAGGGNHTCALLANRTVMCWGRNDFGQLGDGTTTERHTPVTVVGLTDAIALDVGVNDGCVVRAGGGVACWGRNEFGQLGTGPSLGGPNTPVVVLGINNAKAVGVGGDAEHVCAIVTGGGVVCWGRNAAGQLGDGTTTPHALPAPVVNLGGAAISIDAGNDHTCAFLGSGTLRCWGGNGSGQIGNGTTTPTSVPVSVLP